MRQLRVVALSVGGRRASVSRAASSPRRWRGRVRACGAAVALAAGCVAAGCVRAPATPPSSAAAATRSDEEYLRARRLLVPVAGVRAEHIPDTYQARRGSRRHHALDIMAPRGTPVLAADGGRVLKLRTNPTGGITVYATDSAERIIYYYAHLERYRAHLREGMALAKGDTIGFVGTSGNAPRHVPHLHFQITRMPANKQWWGGEPINPLPLLRGELSDMVRP